MFPPASICIEQHLQVSSSFPTRWLYREIQCSLLPQVAFALHRQLFFPATMDHKTDITHVENDVDFDPSDEKQPQARTIANIRVLGLSNEDADFYESYDPEARKALVRKIDVRLVPMLAALYLVSQLDRANIGNAKIEGLDKDLGMTGVQYNIALSMFFVPYVLLEVPSNIMLKKLGRPSLYSEFYNVLAYIYNTLLIIP